MQAIGKIEYVNQPDPDRDPPRINWNIKLYDSPMRFLSKRSLIQWNRDDEVVIDYKPPRPGYDNCYIDKIQKIYGKPDEQKASTKQVRPSMSPADARGAFICLGVTNQFHGVGAHGLTSGDIRQAMIDWGNAYDAFHGNVTIVSTPRTPAKSENTHSELND